MGKEVVMEPITGDAHVVDHQAARHLFIDVHGETLPLHDEIIAPVRGVHAQTERALGIVGEMPKRAVRPQVGMEGIPAF